MKKLFSILFAAMILLSGMHLSLATHLCDGEVSAVKLSFTHAQAGCGMCAEKQTNPTQKNVSSQGCCKDQMFLYAVDTNYSPSTLQIKAPVNPLLLVYYIPSTIGILYSNTKFSVNTNVQPPGEFIASAVTLPDICVFQI